LKQLDIHPEAVDEVGDALRFYGERTADGIADDLNDLINSALDEMARHPQRYPYTVSQLNFVFTLLSSRACRGI
jgi:hypothetical protein